MNSLLNCSVDDALKSLSWNAAELSPSQLSDDDFSEYPSCFPSIGIDHFDEEKKPLASYDETAKSTVPQASSSDAIASLSSAFPRKMIRQQCETETRYAEYTGQSGNQMDQGLDYGFNFSSAQVAASQTIVCAQPRPSFEEEQQKREMWELTLRQLIQDYTTLCANLQLPLDMSDWMPEHTARWLSHKCEQRGIPPPVGLCLPGSSLVKMNLVEFEMLSPIGGAQLFEDVQLWKTAFDSYSHPQHRQNGGGCLTAADNGLMMKWDEGSPVEYASPPQTSLDHRQFMDGNAMRNGYYPTNMPHPQMQQQQYFNNFVTNAPTDSESEGDDMNEDEDSCNQHGMMGGYMDAMSGNLIPKQEVQSPPFHTRPGNNVHLWIFIRELLECPEQYGGCVRWVDREQGTFKIESSQNLARFWGCRKNRSAMNYDKLSRSLRQYYKKGIIQKPEKKQRLVYKFLPPYHH